VSLRSLQSVLRSLVETQPPAGDGELLRRFIDGDEGAFAELVARHGRLVWAVCRNLSGSDAAADDAFQATFLVLLRNAKKIRDPARLSAWLHGVAYRVCAKARQAAKRRATRERAAAVVERNGSAVADSAWDRALAAVHEEAGRLPESLRIPFVLCCLEGKGVTEAAEQLGWKLGTFSGRLTRAKDALMARLDARGLTVGAVVGLGLTVPPSAAVARAAELARAGFVVPKSILQLSHGVMGMSMTSFKMLAAAVLVTCGLGLGVGKGWVATADAQAPAGAKPQKGDPEAEVKRLEVELEKALKAGQLKVDDRERELLGALEVLAAQAAQQKRKVKEGQEEPSAKTSKWEYDFVVVSDMTQGKFVDFLQDRENRGWEFIGTTTLRNEGKPAPVWVFRRPVKGAGSAAKYAEELGKYYQNQKGMPPQFGPQFLNELQPKLKELKGATGKSEEAAKIIEAEIAKLQEKLAALKANPKPAPEKKPAREEATFARKDLPLDAAETAEVLLKLAGKKFKNANYSITPRGNSLVVSGDKEVLEWARDMIKRLGDK
jgi:RNA polymerase sigma factor (sigma-70 family)